MNDLQLFMRLYMYELEMWLNEHKQELLSISFQSDEANTDRPLKEFLKSAIEQHCNCLSRLKNIDSVTIDSESYPVSSSVTDTVINSVILPPISDELKNILKKRKNAVFTEPDMCLVILQNGKPEYVTVELKSTKNDSIPGSSVQQITPDEWVIFIKHTSKTVEVTTGQYFYAINSKMQFPDRSPRPQVSFDELRNWNSRCRKVEGKSVAYRSIGDESEKYGLLTDWQGVLAKRWTDIVFNRSYRKGEPWFNNNLRKFILQFLEQYDAMSDKEKEEYRASLKRNIT